MAKKPDVLQEVFNKENKPWNGYLKKEELKRILAKYLILRGMPTADGEGETEELAKTKYHQDNTCFHLSQTLVFA